MDCKMDMGSKHTGTGVSSAKHHLTYLMFFKVLRSLYVMMMMMMMLPSEIRSLFCNIGYRYKTKACYA